MKKIKLFLIFMFVFPWLSSCSIPDATLEVTQASSGQFINLTLVSFTSSTATVNVQAALPSDAYAPLSTVKIYTNSQCVGLPVGQGLANAFASPGLQALLPISGTSDIYASSNVENKCYFLTDYTFVPGAVSDVQFTRTYPVSPTFDSFTPLIFGTAVSGTVVTVYLDAMCVTAVGSGTAEVYNSTGLRVNLPSNQTSTLYADSTDVLNRKSNCSYLTDYTHIQSLVTLPTFHQIIPMSPSNVTSSPVVRGAVASGTVSVKLYNDPGCSQKIGEGTPNEFYSAGLKINVVPNVMTTIYAKSTDSIANDSACVFLTNYLYDTIAPGAPSFINSTPITPTRLTLYPKFYGSSPSDTAKVKLFKNSDCSATIGNGSKSEFELTGLTGSLTPNAITSVYAQAIDAAGNGSACTFFLNYKHNTIPPDLPVLNATNPVSPNNITPNPYVSGNASVTTKKLYFFSNEDCTNAIGNGTAEDFNSTGIQIFTPNVANSVNLTSISVQAEDEEGNLSQCSSLGGYAYSTAKAQTPAFTQTLPASPSRFSFTPVVFGTAHSSISLVQLYSDANCTGFLGGANRAVFATQGIQVTVPTNASTDIYATSFDVYGNSSDCVYFTTYIHDNILPQAPTFLSTNPTSPNNSSGNPLVKGNVVTNIVGKPLTTNRISFYDSLLCLTQIGFGLPSAYTTSGISVTTPENVVTNVYAVTSDPAGNRSACTYITDYTYSTNPPGRPVLSLSTPGSPSYSKFFNLKGTLAANSGIVSASTVILYKNSSCTTVLVAGTAAQFTSVGIDAVADVNAITPVYGQTTDIVGTQSTCSPLINFSHNNIGPIGLTAAMNIDGSVGLNWQADMIALPVPTYVVKRAKQPGGPYTILSSQNAGNSYRDVSVINGQTYYYVVAATNITGTSYDSSEAIITVTGPAAQAPVNLVAAPGDSTVYLSWTLAGQNLSYKLYRATQPGGPYSLILSNFTGAGYEDVGLTNGQDYYYVIAGVNANGESVQSPQVSVRPLDTPQAPQNLTLTADASDPLCGGSSSVTLTWTPTSYFSNFIIRRGLTLFNLTDLANTTNNTYRDCNPIVQSNSVYVPSYYTIVATWGQGGTRTRSAPSNSVAFFAGSGPVSPSANPGNNHVFVKWFSIVNAQSYQVWRSTVPGWPSSNYTLLDSAFGGVVYTDSTAVNNQSYFYVVVPNYLAASGYPSVEVSAIPKPNPNSPSDLILNLDPVSKMPVLTWKSSNYANDYTVYKSLNGGAYSPIAFSTANKYTDSLSSPGLYSYYVKANWGNFETPATNTVSFRYGTLAAAPTVTRTSSSISLSWASVPTAVSYNIFRGTTAAGPFTLIDNTAATTYSNTTLIPAAYPAVAGQGYFYAVQPVFAGNSPGQSSAVVDGMLSGATVVSGLTVTAATASSISLTWAKLAPSGRTYFVYRALSVSGTYTKLTLNTTTNVYTVSTGLSANTTYFFKVANSTCAMACLSDAVSAITVDAPIAPGVKAGNSMVQVIGTGVGATSYDILRSSDLVNYTMVATSLALASYDDTSAVNGTNYYYRIRANYIDGSQISSPDSVGVTPGITPDAPEQIFMTGNATGSSVDLTWSAIGGADDYMVYYGTSSGGPYPSSQVSTGNSLSISGLTPATDYFFVVRSRKGLIESANSAELVVQPNVSSAAPILKTAGGSVGVSWTAVASASRYNLLRSTDRINFSTLVSGTTSTSFTDTAVVSGSVYYYLVQSFKANNSILAPSTIAGPIRIDLPTPPSGLVAESSSSTSIQLSWTKSSADLLSGYQVYRSTTSGGPYTLIQTTGPTITSYVDIDAALTVGQSYYYVVRSINTYDQISDPTNQVSVRLSTGPALSLSQTNGVMNLSWSSVGAAVQYNIYRSKVSGGPYGLISTTASLNYQDSAVTNGLVYYYVVSAVYADGTLSILSNEVNQLVVKTMNLRLPIELIDQGLASDTSPVTFERSRTSLETTAYDGAVSYELEVIATNLETTNKTVSLVDQADNVVGFVTIPANSTMPVRTSAALTPVAGFQTYRLRLAATTNSSDLQVYSSKIWVTQTGATRTKIYIPLMAPMNSPLNGDLFTPLESVMGTNLTVLNNSDEYQRDVSNLAKIPEYSGWEFESVVSTYGSHGLIALYNTTTGEVVKSTETIFSDTDVTLFNSAFDEGSNEFASGNHLDKYKLAMRCYLDCEIGAVNVYKAGLWVKLENITKSEILVRQSTLLNNIFTVTQNDRFRTMIDLSQYSNPLAFFRASAKASNMGDVANIQVVSNGTGPTADSGVSNLSPVLNSVLNFSESTYTTKQTASPMSLNNQDRFMTEISPQSGGLDIRSSYLVIRAAP